jgi:SAM-dependent methyltransferase
MQDARAGEKGRVMPELEFNHRFVLDFASENAPKGQILDYGCGGGQVVRAGLERGLNIFGCEAFYEGGPHTKELAKDLIGRRILQLNGNIIPVADSSFDCVLSNQVFEHVENLDRVLTEINRVLKPGGVLLSLFPSVGVIREGHCGVPMAHWFSRSRVGYYWLLAGRAIGLGYFKENKTRRQWAHDFRDWLNSYCFYRTKKEIFNSYYSHGFDVRQRERDVIRMRRLPLLSPWMFRALAGMVLESHKLFDVNS